MSKKNWIYLVLVILAVIALPGGFLLATYLGTKKATTPAAKATTPATKVTIKVDPSTIPDSDGSNDTSTGDITDSPIDSMINELNIV